MQDYAFDPGLRRGQDIAKLRAAQDPRLIRNFVVDNSLNSSLFSAIYAAGDILRKEEDGGL